jgi:hypothetical protein
VFSGWSGHGGWGKWESQSNNRQIRFRRLFAGFQ